MSEATKTLVMEPIWQTLPNDLVEHICSFLDPATRRDVGYKPRKLKSLPQLDLHHNEIVYHDGLYSVIAFMKGDIWTDFIFDTEFTSVYRGLRAPFMTVDGIEVYRTEVLSCSSVSRCKNCA